MIIKGLRILLITWCWLLSVSSLLGAGTTVIEVRTEGIGDIHRGEVATNLNGAMVWNGSEWVVNNTWAHKYFINVETGVRLKNYDNPQIYQGLRPTGLIATFGNYSVTRHIYTYREPARAGNPVLEFPFEAAEYVIQDAVTGRQIILRSRGTGRVTTQAFFNIYIEDDVLTGVQTTALRGDPKWYTYPLRAAEAVNQTGETEYLTGDLPGALTTLGTRAGDYYLDIGGGADLGPVGIGKSFQFHTSTLDPATTDTVNLGSSFPIDFNLKWMDSSGNLQMLRFLPVVVNRLYLPDTAKHLI